MSGPVFLGVEIGGTKLQLGLGNGLDPIDVLDRQEVDREAGAEGVLAQVRAALTRLLKNEAGSPRAVAGVGIGFGGPINLAAGRVLISHQVGGWADFPLRDWFHQATGCPVVVVRNDAHTAALAESRFGAGRGCSPLLYVTIGTGIGGGLVVDGRIYDGSVGVAIEVGHLWVPGPSGACHLETVASGPGLSRHAEMTGEIALQPVTPVTLAQAARRGDAQAKQALRMATNSLAQALAQAITILAPQRIILGGGVSLIGEDFWFGPIREALDDWTFDPLRGTFDIVPSALGEDVVVRGALALARDAWEAAQG